MIHWLSHASFRFEAANKIVYTDPWELKTSSPKADVVLITHAHYDHCSLEDVTKIVKDGTVVVTPADCVEKLQKFQISNLRLQTPQSEISNLKFEVARPGDVLTVNGVKIEVVPAYNMNKPFHPKQNNWVGFIFTLGDERIYQAGDTDAIPEMKNIKADTVLLPIGGTYTMNADVAAGVANMIRPKLAIPMHWGKIVGSQQDAETFKKLCKCEVNILGQE